MENILLIKLGALGGVLRSTSILAGLKNKFPECNLQILTKKNAEDLLKYNKDLDKIWFWETDKDKLKEISFDWVINTEDDDETCSFLSQLNTKKITGPFKTKEGISYTQDSAIWHDSSKISKLGLKKANELKKQSKKSYQEMYTEILKLPKNEPLVLNLDKEEKEFSRNFRIKNNLSKKDILVGVNTGAGTNWPLKSISAESTIELINELIKNNFKVVLLGGLNEKERNLKIINEVGEKVIDAGIENDLRHFIAIINSLDILITSDTLALHIATALKKRIVSFFGPTSAEEIDLYGQGVKIKPLSDCYCCFQKARNKPRMCIDEIKIGDLVKETINQVKFL